MGKPLDLTAEIFTMLQVLKRLPNSKDGKTMWLCRCECGKEVSVMGTELKRNRKKSCGCAHNKLLSISKTKHGRSKTPEFKAWSSMKERCLCKMNKAYEGYGGRGISICAEWVNSFETFLKDMGNKPSKKHSLDRKNNEMGYCKENCRWATDAEQNRNKRTNVNPISKNKGISFRKKTGKYESRIMVDKKRIHLGSYSNLEKAIEARKKAETQYWK
jgi:hypothetical protein